MSPRFPFFSSGRVRSRNYPGALRCEAHRLNGSWAHRIYEPLRLCASAPLLVRQHALHGLRVRARDLDFGAQLGLTARALLGQDVRMKRVIALEFARTGLLEPFRGSAMRLHLRHNFPLKAWCVTGLSC